MLNVLYWAYVLFFALLFLSKDFYFAHSYFTFVIAPLALIPIKLDWCKTYLLTKIPRVEFSFANTAATLSYSGTKIFLCLTIFAGMISLMSWLTPTPTSGWFWPILNYYLSILLFLLVTARLANSIPDFHFSFFTFLSAVVAVNAAINIYLYFNALPQISDFASVRLQPSFGRVPDAHPVPGALPYAIFLVSTTLLMFNANTHLRRVMMSVASVVLFSALVLTQSRGPLLAALVALVLAALISSPGKRLIMAGTAFGAAILFLSIPAVGRAALARGENHRLEVWLSYLKLALDRPFSGYGERLQTFVEISDGEILGHAHNIWISAFLRGGAVSLIALGLASLLGLVATYRYGIRNQNIFPFAILSAPLVAGLVDFDLLVFLADWQWVCFWLPFGVAIGAEKYLNSCRLSNLKHA